MAGGYGVSAWNKSDKFEETFLPFLSDIYRTAFRLTSNREDAEDLTQETFIKAFRAWSKRRDVRNARAWLFRILRNTINDHYKKRTSTTPHISLNETDERALPEELLQRESPEDLLLMKSAAGRLKMALQRMPIEYRMTLLLCDSEGLSYAEIARIQDCPVGTVRSRLNRARKILKDFLVDKDTALNGDGFVKKLICGVTAE